MLDMGFIPDIERICKLLPFTRQTLFFSATMLGEIQRLADNFLHRPERIEIAPQSTAAATIVQRLKKAPDDAAGKREALRALMRETNVKNAIIFCNRKKDVGIVHRSLQRHGFSVGALHGDLDQHQRTATLDAFRNGTIAFLAASDVAARGLDIPDVSHIFNYDVPIHPEDYIHRIGRTGCAGREGFAATLVTPKEMKAIKAIERMLRQEIPWIDGQQSADEGERSSDHRGRSNGRHRRGSRPTRNKGGAAHGAPQRRSEGQRKDNGGREGHKPQQPQPQQNQQRRDHQQPRRLSQRIPQHQSLLGIAPPRSRLTALHQSLPTSLLILTRAKLPRRSNRKPSPIAGHRPPPPKPQQQPSPGVRGMGEHVPAFMMCSVRPSIRAPGPFLKSQWGSASPSWRGSFEARFGCRREGNGFAAAAGGCLVRIVEHEARAHAVGAVVHLVPSRNRTALGSMRMRTPLSSTTSSWGAFVSA